MEPYWPCATQNIAFYIAQAIKFENNHTQASRAPKTQGPIFPVCLMTTEPIMRVQVFI